MAYPIDIETVAVTIAVAENAARIARYAVRRYLDQRRSLDSVEQAVIERIKGEDSAEIADD